MMEAHVSKPPSSNEDQFLYLLGLFVGIVICLRIWSNIRFDVWNWYFNHRSLVVLFVSTLILAGFIVLVRTIKTKRSKNIFDQEISNGKNGDAVYAGVSDDKKPVFINLSYRRMHAQVVGTTNAGKTESVIVPWAINDIEKGRGLIIIDGKADKVLLNKLYAYAVKSKRSKDFRVFSLSDYGISHTYNPLAYGSVVQITEKVFNSFEIENEYYKNVQFDVFKQVLTLFQKANIIPTFLKIKQALMDTSYLKQLSDKTDDQFLKEWVTDYSSTNKETRKEQISGLMAHLGYFTSDEVSSLFNTEYPSINISQIMNESLISFIQLPVLKSPMLGKAVAKMMLQDIQGAVSERHASGKEDHPFMGVYLDDFSEYLTKSFVSILNKSRSANVGVTFAHQAVGDLEGLGPEVKNQIQTNTNLKVFMRTNEPESAEYYSKTIGTKLTEKVTKRQTQGIFGKEVTGEGSLREAEEFIYHPNIFKRELGLGEAILILSHERGSKPIKIKFGIRENLPAQIIPEYFKKAPEPLVIAPATAKKDEIIETNVLEQAAISNKELIKKINQGVPVW